MKLSIGEKTDYMIRIKTGSSFPLPAKLYEEVNQLRSILSTSPLHNTAQQRPLMIYCLINVIVVEVVPVRAVRKNVPARYDLPISIV